MKRLGLVVGWWPTMLCLAAVVLLVGVPFASASPNVLLMRNRQALKGTPIVVWGNTKLPAGLATLTFGDGGGDLNGTIGGAAPFTDRTYIAALHTYNMTGSFEVKLTVAGESETTTVDVVDPASLTTEGLRTVMINNAIEDGLRNLYVTQDNRTAVSNTQSWSFDIPHTSLVVLALENHGHFVGNDPTKDVFQDVVQRGLNFIFDRLAKQTLTIEPAGDPCVGVPNDADRCTGLRSSQNQPGYSTSLAGLAIAGSNAPNRIVGAGLGSINAQFVAGRTYKEVLQRIINTVAWGAADTGANRGGYRYGLDDNQSDGSAIGWAVLAYLDAQAFGATIPSFVATELAFVIKASSCPQPAGDLSNGLSYAGCGRGNVLRTGIALQALKFMGVPANDIRVTNAKNYIGTAWNNLHPNGEDFTCGNPSSLGPGSPTGSANNKGCLYAMFQVFKGLRLYGVQILPGVNRPANPLNHPRVGDANDWYEDYRDYLIANQQLPITTAGGNWGPNQAFWSCCENNNHLITAAAELVLSQAALVLPGSLTVASSASSYSTGASAVVTVKALSAGNAPVPGATVNFKVIAGPNAGKPGTTGNVLTDAQGKAAFAYSDVAKIAGTDQVQASISGLTSNVANVTWVVNPTVTASVFAVTSAGGLMKVDLKLQYVGPPNAQNVTISRVLPMTAPVTYSGPVLPANKGALVPNGSIIQTLDFNINAAASGTPVQIVVRGTFKNAAGATFYIGTTLTAVVP